MEPTQFERLMEEIAALRSSLDGERAHGAAPGVDQALWLTSILAHSPDVISILDREGRMLYLNRTLGQRPVSQLLGRNAGEFVPESQRALWAAAVERAWTTGEVQTLEVYSLGDFWWSTRLAPIRDRDRIVCVLSLGTDITARKRAESALEVKEAQLQLALKASGMGQWSWEIGAAQFEWDAATRRILGWTDDEPVPSPTELLAYIPQDDRERAHAHMQRTLTRGDNPTLEHRMNCPDGVERSVLVSLRPMLDQAGAIKGMHGLMLDVSQQRRSAAEVERAQRLEALGQLAGGVAHDFNNLLVAIMGNIELASNSTTAQERSALLREALASSARAAELTRQLLAFGRRQHIHECPVDVQAMLEDTVRLLRRLVPVTIEIHVEPTPQLTRVLGDRSQLEQVFVNLCINARDAMPNGGRLALTTDLTTIDGDLRSAHPWVEPGRYVRVTVSDTGTGIEPHVLGHIFEPFFTTKDSGTGLGLASAYGVVKQHGGFLNVHSAPGAGATFEVYLPAAERDAAEIPPGLDEPVRGGAELILLAEDEDPVRRVVALILGEAGYRVRETRNGAEAVAAFTEAPDAFDLVLLDAVMPQKSGAQAAAEIHAIRPDIAIILSSGYSDVLATDPRAIGDMAFLAKPYEPDTLLRMVRHALDGRAKAEKRS